MNLSDWIVILLERYSIEEVLTEIGEGFNKASQVAYEKDKRLLQQAISDAAAPIWNERNRLMKLREHRK